MEDVYDTDILIWSERQADLLRRRAANALDWDHLAEEIEDLVRSELRAVESHLVQAMLEDLKVMAWPGSREVPHWRAEARGQRDDAKAAFTPSMMQRIDVGLSGGGRCGGCLRRSMACSRSRCPRPVR